MKHLIAAAMMYLMVACATAGVDGTAPGENEKLKENHEETMALIRGFNEKAVTSIEGSFFIDGFLQNKKYKTIGNVSYSAAPERLNLIITDFIFKSPITTVVQDGRELSIYFPVEKKLYVDSVDTIRLKNYSDIDFNFAMLHGVLTGRIPLVRGHRIVSCVRDEAKNARFLIVENDELFETIAFRGDIPDKLLFMDKKSKKRVEFYLGRPTVSGDSVFFRNIKIVAKDEGINLTITFNSLKLNGPVRVKNVSEMNYPRNISIIRM